MVFQKNGLKEIGKYASNHVRKYFSENPYIVRSCSSLFHHNRYVRTESILLVLLLLLWQLSSWLLVRVHVVHA